MTETFVEVESRYCDIDPMGIVHHGVYPLWCEIARVNFFNTIGIDFQKFAQLGISPAMVNLNMDYTAPVTFPSQIKVRTHICDYGPKKIKLMYEMFLSSENAPVNICTTTHVWVDGSMKSVNIETDYPQYYAYIEAAAN